MDNRRAEFASHDISVLFLLGALGSMSDEQLLEKFAVESEADRQIAFEAIVRRHGPMVLGVCRRVLRHEQDAEDAFQATFMVLALRAGMIRKRKSLGPWLHGVAARIARRARFVSRRLEQQPIPPEPLVSDDERDPPLADLEEALDIELCRLPDKYRLPIVLCYLEGKTQEAAAAELGWPKGTVSGRLARAKELLLERLTRRGLAPSVGLLAVLPAPEMARAALPRRLVSSTVRAATLASFGGVTTGFVTVGVTSFVRHALKVMFLRRIAKITVLLVLCGIGASVIATPVLLPNPPPRRVNRDAASAASAKAPAILRATAWHHPARVVAIAFSANENTVLTAQADGVVRFWDPVTGRQEKTVNLSRRTADSHTAINQFAIAPDGRYMGAVGFVRDQPFTNVQHTLWIGSVQGTQPARTIVDNSSDLQCLAFSPDGATVATGARGEVKLWDVATGDCRDTLGLEANQSFFSLSFTPDGKTLAIIDMGKGINLWNLQEKEATLIAIPTIGGSRVYFSPDGRYIAFNTFDETIASWDHLVIWDRVLGKTHLEAPGTPQGFAPDSRSLAVITSGKTRSTAALSVLNTETGDRLWSADLGPAIQQGGASFATAGQTIFVAWDNVARSFNAATGRERPFSQAPNDGTIANGVPGS